MREVRGEEAGGGSRGGRGRGCGGTLMTATPNRRMEARRDAGDATQAGKSADVRRRRSDRCGTGPVVLVLQVLNVDQAVLVFLLDVLGLRAPGPGLVRAASWTLGAEVWLTGCGHLRRRGTSDVRR